MVCISSSWSFQILEGPDRRYCLSPKPVGERWAHLPWAVPVLSLGRMTSSISFADSLQLKSIVCTFCTAFYFHGGVLRILVSNTEQDDRGPEEGWTLKQYRDEGRHAAEGGRVRNKQLKTGEATAYTQPKPAGEEVPEPGVRLRRD